MIVLLCGGDKPTQQDDIIRAREIADEWRNKEHGNGQED